MLTFWKVSILHSAWTVSSERSIQRISTSTIMAMYFIKTSARAMPWRDGGVDGEVYGLLIDWDISCFVEEADGNTSPIPHLRTGTTPFMAIDLQRGANGISVAPEHRYCHDLESFFWSSGFGQVLWNWARPDCFLPSTHKAYQFSLLEPPCYGASTICSSVDLHSAYWDGYDRVS